MFNAQSYKRRSTGRAFQAAALLGSLAIFLVMAALESRWIAQLSEAELERGQIRLRESIRAVRSEINRELTSAFFLFQLEPNSPPATWGKMTAEAFGAWRRVARYPGVVRGAYVVRPSSAGLVIAAFNPASQEYEAVAWPAPLAALQNQLALPFHGFEVFGVRKFTGVLLADVPVLVCPMFPAASSQFHEVDSWQVLELDQSYLLQQMLPKLIQQHVRQAGEFDYQIARDAYPDQIVYRSNPRSPLADVDARCTLLELGREFLRSEAHGRLEVGKTPNPARPDQGIPPTRHQRWFSSMISLPGVPPAPNGEGGVWELQVRHRLGSLQAASTRLRRGNQALAVAMMVLVAADLVVLAMLARRAQRLGEARLQFAAAVSHELRTPLAAICSAADNLAAGVTHEPSKVQQYGAAILRQGRQLGGLVEQILAFVTGQSGKQPYQMAMIDPVAVLIRSIDVLIPAARAAGVVIAEDIPPDLPPVVGDAEALQQAVVNLLSNAIKHGASGGKVLLSARLTATGELEIGVEDKGRGIPAAEQKRIFEPFYRGSSSGNGSHGAGLGLTIVAQIARAHHGSVAVTSALGRGSRFTLRLPAT